MVVVPDVITRRRLTLQDYEALPDDQDYEIVEGRLYVAPRPRPRHQIIAHRLAYALTQHAEAAGEGTVIPDADLVFDEQGTYVSPDVMYFSAGRLANWNPDERLRVVPDLVVEVLSPGTEEYDLTTKRDLYARLGVQSYWIVDASRKVVVELTLGRDQRYTERVVHAPSEFRPAALPGFALDLGRLFR